jgi:hypothetical protein
LNGDGLAAPRPSVCSIVSRFIKDPCG